MASTLVTATVTAVQGLESPLLFVLAVGFVGGVLAWAASALSGAFYRFRKGL